MQEYRYIKEYEPFKQKTILKLGEIYRIEKLERYMFNVHSRLYNITICTITQRMLNHFFEEVK